MTTKINQPKLNTYIITLRSKLEPTKTVKYKGKGMMVNHRGDLLITATTNSYDLTKVVAVFSSGSWVRAELEEDNNAN